MNLHIQETGINDRESVLFLHGLGVSGWMWHDQMDWVGSEHGLKFVFKSNQGWSPGLFLDQRANRNWVHQNSAGKTVLNLFCYTGGFSVAAAKGGAERVESVDTSAATLNWSKENFAANDIDVSQHGFFKSDAREFLKIAKKKERQFDTIICDPPSFARSKNYIQKHSGNLFLMFLTSL